MEGIFIPRVTAPHGSPEWEEQCEAEVKARPRVLPLDKRHQWTPTELEALRQNIAAGMPRAKAVEMALGAK